MMAEPVRGNKSFLDRIGGRIFNIFRSGKVVYMENPMEKIVLRYVPREYSKYGKYYVKYYGRDSNNINFNSVSILMAVMEGRRISKTRYDSYRLNEGVIWKRKYNSPGSE